MKIIKALSSRNIRREANSALIHLVKRKLACANRMMEVYLDEISSPKGETIFDFIVLSPRQKSDNQVTGVAILPVLDGNLGLLQIYRHPVGEYTWEIPRGFIDAGEKAPTAALRELEEETGLQCDHQQVIDLGTILPEPGILAARTHLFAASRCRRARPYRANELGHKELRFFTQGEFAAMAQKGEIEEAHTLAVYYRYHQFQETIRHARA